MRLETCNIDVTVASKYGEQMTRLRELVMESEIFQLVPVEHDPDPFSSKLQGPGLEKRNIEFRWGMSDWVDHAVQNHIDWMRRL